MPAADLVFEERHVGAVTGWSYADAADATYDVRVGVLEVPPAAAAPAAAAAAA